MSLASIDKLNLPSPLNDLSSFQYQNLICILNCGQSVSNDYGGGPISAHLIYSILRLKVF